MRTENYRRPREQNRPMGSERPGNWGSARSDYGSHAYGGRLNEQGEERGWWDKTADEVSSWFGDEGADRRRRMDERYNSIQNRHEGWRNQGSGTYPVGFDAAAMMPSYPAFNYQQDWRSLRAGDIMTRRVALVLPNDTVQFAARLMRDCDCGALPVVDRQRRMIGMITDRDIAVRLVAGGYDPRHALVSDCMTKGAFACHENESLRSCMASMARHQIRRLPIVNDRNQVVGIISQSDIARHAERNQGSGERRALADVMRTVSEPSSRAYR